MRAAYSSARLRRSQRAALAEAVYRLSAGAPRQRTYEQFGDELGIGSVGDTDEEFDASLAAGPRPVLDASEITCCSAQYLGMPTA